MFAQFESGRTNEARKAADRLLALLPRLTSDLLGTFVADEAIELRARSIAAARGSGIP
jgi:hypothetical protein